MLHDALPIVMVKNESRFIQRVLRPLAAVFGTVVVGDTGSEDGTAELAEAVAGVEVLRMGKLSAYDLGQARSVLSKRVLELGRQNVLMVDGDELYCEATLRHMLTQEFPNERSLLFTTLVSLDDDENGDVWEMNDDYSRTAVFRADEKWRGAYPFEYPTIFDEIKLHRHYVIPEGFRYHGVHLHRLQRSVRDDLVVGRVAKQKQFCLQNLPHIKRTVPFDLDAWCAVGD